MSRATPIQQHRRLLMSAMRSWAALKRCALTCGTRIQAACGARAVSQPPIRPVDAPPPLAVPANIAAEQPSEQSAAQAAAQAGTADILPLYFERLLDRVDPYANPLHAAAHQQQVAAGRWLLLRRLQHNLTVSAVAQHAGITPAALQLMEAGVADPALMPLASLEPLARILADCAEDREQVLAALNAALGRRRPARDALHPSAPLRRPARHAKHAAARRSAIPARLKDAGKFAGMAARALLVGILLVGVGSQGLKQATKRGFSPPVALPPPLVVAQPALATPHWLAVLHAYLHADWLAGIQLPQPSWVCRWVTVQQIVPLANRVKVMIGAVEMSSRGRGGGACGRKRERAIMHPRRALHERAHIWIA